MFRDRPEMREPAVRVCLSVPRSDLVEIDREVLRREKKFGRAAASRDSIIREAIRAHFTRLAEERLRLTPGGLS
jgi:hypothetical protein